MDSSKRRLSGPGPTGTSQKRPNVSAPGTVEEEAIEEQMAVLPESPEDDADDIDQHMLEEDLELHLGEAGRNWERPAPPPLDPSAQSLGESSCMHCPVPSLCMLLLGLCLSPLRLHGSHDHHNTLLLFG